jgi:hypothetical protein
VTQSTRKGDAHVWGCCDVPHSVVRSERVHVGCDSIAPVVEMRAKSHERPNVEVPLIGSRQGERGCEITPTWARSGSRYVATAPHVGTHWGHADRAHAISAITPLAGTAPGMNVGARSRPRGRARARGTSQRPPTWGTRRGPRSRRSRRSSPGPRHPRPHRSIGLRQA